MFHQRLPPVKIGQVTLGPKDQNLLLARFRAWSGHWTKAKGPGEGNWGTGGGGHPNAGRGGMELGFGPADVGTAAEQVGGQPHGHLRRVRRNGTALIRSFSRAAGSRPNSTPRL